MKYILALCMMFFAAIAGAENWDVTGKGDNSERVLYHIDPNTVTTNTDHTSVIAVVQVTNGRDVSGFIIKLSGCNVLTGQIAAFDFNDERITEVFNWAATGNTVYSLLAVRACYMAANPGYTVPNKLPRGKIPPGSGNV